MKSISSNMFCCVMMGVMLTAATTEAVAQKNALSAATMIIEYNSSAEDIGVQFFLDSEGWQQVEIFDPRGQVIFHADTRGRLTQQGGGTELFLESVEPPIAALSFATFFNRFPEGIYKFQGRDRDGNLLKGQAKFTHAIPAGPEILLPTPAPGAECAEDVPASGAVIAWNPVTESISGDPLKIVGYEVIVENEEDGLNFDVKFPAETGTMLSLPPELLKRGTQYIGEVLAVESGGNQTISEFCFTTAP